ncbi:microtubule-associated protein Jupiter isoform X2 [Drosophila ficusphila]|uniref:microtubule-associated protein Jupiter isoform X2 n=2 Tax=Drosophila ficusphila TaxID=30025 RepID=UPI0007E8B539|nr:microtubule-associated protein Jupiter isoform X2 [Drosophila ficusphila]
MAAYAAFKHVELYNVGKAKKRVMRPPGGGSSDIFGSEMPQTPRNVKNRMASNIFAAEKDNGVKNNVRQGAHRFYFIGDAPRRGQKTVDSHSRLFGEPTRPITPGKNHMKSSIPFGGQNGETAAAQKLLTTTNGHYNGKSGSVSSASSSVSSSTENLKMNSGSRSVFRNMSTGPDNKASSPLDLLCPSTAVPDVRPVAPSDAALSIDNSCQDNEIGDVPADNSTFTESDKVDQANQTRRDSGNNPDQPFSLNKMSGAPDLKEPLELCPNEIKEPTQECKQDSRNPITGLGLNGDGVGGLKPKKLKIREGNPVTGEGYKAGANDYHQRQESNNGGTPVINKNRVPPGGYSSGLW